MVEPIYQPRNAKISRLYPSILNHFSEFDASWFWLGKVPPAVAFGSLLEQLVDVRPVSSAEEARLRNNHINIARG